jgi:hypothetical protein
MRNKHLLWTRNNIITILLLPLGHIPFTHMFAWCPIFHALKDKSGALKLFSVVLFYIICWRQTSQGASFTWPSNLQWDHDMVSWSVLLFFQVWPITSYDASWILGFSSYAGSCIERNYLSSRRDQVYPSLGVLLLHAHVGSTPTLVFLLSFLLVYIFCLATKLHTKDPFHAERLGHRRLH